ncbi:MAG: hypothetical protein HS117_26620 [Verrucomicrobiaceae bacterium]|jgi:hypothetical protein|nr:hypothetical protein [Verrucomicrobiaceae bacterium]
MQTRRALLTALLVLVVLCAQIMGMRRGFVCDCGGGERLTMMDHCHGPHEHDCADEEHDTPAHDRHDHHDDEEEPVHEHPALIESFQADKAAMPVFTTPSAPVLVLLPFDLIHGLEAHPVSARRFHPPRETSRAGPLWPARLAHSITLLI